MGLRSSPAEGSQRRAGAQLGRLCRAGNERAGDGGTSTGMWPWRLHALHSLPARKALGLGHGSCSPGTARCCPQGPGQGQAAPLWDKRATVCSASPSTPPHRQAAAPVAPCCWVPVGAAVPGRSLGTACSEAMGGTHPGRAGAHPAPVRRGADRGVAAHHHSAPQLPENGPVPCGCDGCFQHKQHNSLQKRQHCVCADCPAFPLVTLVCPRPCRCASGAQRKALGGSVWISGCLGIADGNTSLPPLPNKSQGSVPSSLL